MRIEKWLNLPWTDVCHNAFAEHLILYEDLIRRPLLPGECDTSTYVIFGGDIDIDTAIISKAEDEDAALMPVRLKLMSLSLYFNRALFRPDIDKAAFGLRPGKRHSVACVGSQLLFDGRSYRNNDDTGARILPPDTKTFRCRSDHLRMTPTVCRAWQLPNLPLVRLRVDHCLALASVPINEDVE